MNLHGDTPAAGQHGGSISSREWLNIGLGGVVGFFLVYSSTHSFLATLLAGIPSGMGGVALALLLLKNLCPQLYFGDVTRMRSPKYVAAFGMQALVLSNLIWLLLPPNTPKFLLVFADLFLALNVVYALIQRHYRTQEF